MIKKFNEKEKWCPMCSKFLLLSEFGNQKKSASGKQAYCKNCAKIRYKRYDRAIYARKSRYGITDKRYKKLLEEQKEKCKICGRKNIRLCVDHNHDTKKIRGLLCIKCNAMLGHLEAHNINIRQLQDYVAVSPYDIVAVFENEIAKWAGSKYAVAVESGTAALFLSCVYSKVKEVTIPKFTYPSVPCSIIHAGGTVKFSDDSWKGVYELKPYNIIDGALRFQPNMYKGGLHCLSFHMKKHLPIGRGGMVLTDDEKAYKWLKKARFDGRDEVPLGEDDLDVLGWNMYLTPEQASRGLQLFSTIHLKSLEDLDSAKQGYPDLSMYPIYAQTQKSNENR